MLFAVACNGTTENASAACDDVEVQAFKELMIVDDAIVDDARSRNRTAGPWSFRYVMENLVPAGVEPGTFARAWLLNWVTSRELNGFRLDRAGEERDALMNELVLCPWYRRTPENQCDQTCTRCAATKLDLAEAPFRLSAIVNRMDQRDEIPSEPSGEGRLVFGLTDGPGDDPASKPMAMALIFEYRLPETRTPQQWAESWHGLAKHAAFDDAYKAELEVLTNAFVARGSNPNDAHGTSLAQLRTNERVLNWIWQLREFKLQPEGALRLVPIQRNPAEAFNNTPTLATWVKNNAQAIAQKKFELPSFMQSGSADIFMFSWKLPGVDEAAEKAFAEQTCNGCHSTNQIRDTAFHVSPFRRGTERLSTFVFNPGKTDELTSRTRVMRRTLCGG